MEMQSSGRLAPARDADTAASGAKPRITVALRLTIGFGFVILLLLASFWIAGSRLGELNRLVERLAYGQWSNVELAHEVVGRMNDSARATLEQFHGAERARLRARIERNRREIDALMEQIGARLSEPRGRRLFELARSDRAAFVASFERVAQRLDAGERSAAERLLQAETLPALDRALAAFDSLEREQGAEFERAAHEAMQAYRGGLGLLAVFVVAAWAAASLSALWIIRRVTRPLGGEPEEATAIARRIAAGDLKGEIRVRPGDRQSLMAAMKSMQESMHDLLVLLNDDAEEIEALNRDLEARVQRRTAELEAANRELESFGHAMAHDLQTPLRAQEGFSRLLLEEHAKGMDAEALDCARRINASSRRMSRLLDDLLDLMSVSRAQMSDAEVDLSELARGIAEELRAAEPQRRARVEIEPGLIVRADAAMMGIVLRKLLGNAWKFTRPREEAHIAFGALDRDGRREYFVRDDGVGFDPAYAGKLFQPFRRLVTLHQFEGSGVGLATVKRIVERHDGRLRAEAAPDAGATFFFTLSGAAGSPS